MLGHWPRGRGAEVAAAFPSDIALWQKFQGRIRNRHGREGVEWRRGQVSYLEPIRDQFLYDFDNVVSSIPDATLQRNLRKLYLKTW